MYNWRLAAVAFVTVCSVRILLWLLPFRWLQSVLHVAVPSRLQPENPHRRQRIALAVRVVSAWVPRASCLTQALSVQALLKLKGDSLPMRLGVYRRMDGGFKAHAWLESDGKVLIGDLPDLDQFQPLAGSKLSS